MWVELTGDQYVLREPSRPPPLPNLDRLELWDTMLSTEHFGPLSFLLNSQVAPRLRHLTLMLDVAGSDSPEEHTDSSSLHVRTAQDDQLLTIHHVLAQLHSLALSRESFNFVRRFIMESIVSSSPLRTLAFAYESMLAPDLEGLDFPIGLDCISIVHKPRDLECEDSITSGRQLPSQIWDTTLAPARSHLLRFSTEWCS